MKKTIEDWNTNLPNNDELTKAVDGDIVELIDGVYFLCQREYDCNNIQCYAIEPPSICHIKSMYRFIIILYENYNIRFIRVEGNSKRYKFLESVFGHPAVIRDYELYPYRNVFYCDISEAITKLKQVVEFDE